MKGIDVIIKYRMECLIFAVVLIAFSSVIYSCRLLLPQNSDLFFLIWSPRTADFIQMGSVGLAGLIAMVLMERSVRNIGFGGASARYFAWAACIPLLCDGSVYLFCWALGFASFKGYSILAYGVAASLFRLPLNLVAAAGEEIGWRGTLTPALVRISGPVRAGFLCGLAWAAWHYIDIVYFGYNVGTPPLYAIACFTTSVIGMALFLTWLRLASNSVWPPTLFHGVHNTVIYSIFERATHADDKSVYFTSEFGIGLAIASTALGFASLRLLRKWGVAH